MGGSTCPSSSARELQADTPPSRSEPGLGGGPAKTQQVPWDQAFWPQGGMRDQGASCGSAGAPERPGLAL